MPNTDPMMHRSVRPRDAASLVIIDTQQDEMRVLMGRRNAKMKFVPDAFVFPGGKLDPGDVKAQPATQLSKTAYFGARTNKHIRSLAMAAVRETYEETGLILAKSGHVGLDSGPGWVDFLNAGIAPDLAALKGVARAITPPQSPIRFHARFFSCNARLLQGTLKGSGELEDLAWYPISQALKLPMIDVTEFVLNEIHVTELTRKTPSRVPLFSYRNNMPIIRR